MDPDVDRVLTLTVRNGLEHEQLEPYKSAGVRWVNEFSDDESD